MASLTGSTIAASYEQLLSLPDGGLNGNTLVAITDGDSSTAIGMKVATNKIEVIPGSNDANAFEVSQADGTAILTVDSSTPKVTITGDTYVANGSGVIVGHTSQETISIGDGSTDLVPEVQVLGTAQADASLMLAAFSATATSAGAPLLALVKSGDAAIDGTHVIVTDGEELGNIIAYGDDGVDLESPAASIQFEVDGTPGAGDMPGRILFNTSPDGGSVLTEAMRISQDGTQNQQGNYIVNEQGRQDHVANTMSSPYYRFDGVNDRINIPATNLEKVYSVAIWVYFAGDITGRGIVMIDGNDFPLYLNGSSLLVHGITGESDTIGTDAVTANKWTHIVCTRDNDAVNFYIDGVADSGGELTTFSSAPALKSSAVFGVMADSDGGYECEGMVSDVKFYNLELSATEVKELYSGASVPYKYKGANQTNMVTTAANGDFSDSGNWASNGNHTVTITGGEMVVVASGASDGSSNAATIGYGTFDDNGGTVGKAYNYRFKARASTGTPTLRARTPLEWAGTDTEDFTLSTTMQTFEISAKVKNQVQNAYFGLLESGTFYIDDVELVPAGAVAEYDGSGVGASRWDDKSGNELHGTVSGATVENAPADADSGLTYEEGSYTATISESGGQTPTSTAGSSKLSYTKIGRLVTVVGTIQIDNIDSGSGALQIGLPFTPKANDVGTGYHASYVGTYDVDILGDGEAVFAQIAPSTAYTSLAAVRDGATSVAQIATGFYRLQIQYEV